MRSSFRTTLLISALAFASQSTTASACPNCKEAIAAQPNESGAVASGYNWSVLFMMAMPFTLFGAGAFFVKRAANRGLFPEL